MTAEAGHPEAHPFSLLVVPVTGMNDSNIYAYPIGPGVPLFDVFVSFC